MRRLTRVPRASILLVFCIAVAAGAPLQTQPGGSVVPKCVTAATWSSHPVPGEDLWASGGPGGAFVAVKTNAGNFALLSLSAGATLVLESAELFSEDGKVLSNKEYLRIPGGEMFDLDAGTAATDKTADIRWNTSGAKSLEPVNDAMIYLCRPSDRRSTPR